MNGAPCRILVVEDDWDIRQCLVEILADASYVPVAVGNGREALEVLRSDPVKPAVILLDLMMPVMDGREFRDIQRGDASLSEIPVVLLTAYANEERATAGMGRVRYVRKPVDLELLLETLAEICGPCGGAPFPAA